VTDEHTVDRHLGAIYQELVTSTYLTKQVMWSAPSSLRGRLRALLGFLIEQSHAMDEAEARINGRAAGLASPSEQPRTTLDGADHNDVQAAFAAYTTRLIALVGHLRERAADLGDAPEATLVREIASGLEARVAKLQRPE
jgi:hypothetical protein